MTGRVCPVHGEWSATGVCRWCEPEDMAQAEYVPPTAHPPSRYWPVKSVTRDELVEMFGEPTKTPTEYDWTRGPEVDMLDALDAPLYAEVPPPGELSEAMVGLLARLPPAPSEWTLTPTEPCLDYAHAAEQSRLATQHAALRWERVARRWAAKGPTPPLHRTTVEGAIVFDDHCAECLRLAKDPPP